MLVKVPSAADGVDALREREIDNPNQRVAKRLPALARSFGAGPREGRIEVQI
jgi:hypothetical protein